MTLLQRKKDPWKDRLRAAGLRVTSARLAVLRHLASSETPLTHGEVCTLLVDEPFDRATLYRNLMDLVEVGILRRTDVGDHAWRFELIDGTREGKKDPHPHFVCSDCGIVECLPFESVAVKASRGSPRALRAKSVEIQVRGRCDTCN